jgi:phage protein U
MITLNDIHIFGRTPLDEGSARRRGLYVLNKINTRQTAITLPSGRPQTYALDGATTLVLDR